MFVPANSDCRFGQKRNPCEEMTKFFSMIALCVLILLGAAYVDINTYLYSGVAPLPPAAPFQSFLEYSPNAQIAATEWVVKNNFELNMKSWNQTDDRMIFEHNTIMTGGEDPSACLNPPCVSQKWITERPRPLPDRPKQWRWQ